MYGSMPSSACSDRHRKDDLQLSSLCVAAFGVPTSMHTRRLKHPFTLQRLSDIGASGQWRLDVPYMPEYVSVMKTKLTLRMDESLVEKGKFEADRRGKSVSQMVGDFFDSLSTPNQYAVKTLPPLTASLVGVLKGHRTDVDAYKKHLASRFSTRRSC